MQLRLALWWSVGLKSSKVFGVSLAIILESRHVETVFRLANRVETLIDHICLQLRLGRIVERLHRLGGLLLAAASFGAKREGVGDGV